MPIYDCGDMGPPSKQPSWARNDGVPAEVAYKHTLNCGHCARRPMSTCPWYADLKRDFERNSWAADAIAVQR